MPQSLHIFGQEEGLLQGYSNVGGMPFLELPDRGVPWDGSAIQLQPRSLNVLLLAHLGST